MEGNNRKDLKAYVRYDGSGRVVPSSLVLRRKMPKVGNWKEIEAYQCCNPVSQEEFLLTEDSDYLLQENEGRIIL
jgi:hypothetical protein